MVDEVEHRHTTYPISLFSDALTLSLDSFLLSANPVHIHIQGMLKGVEDRIEAENRATIRSVLDHVTTRIKRRGRKKEPGFVLRHIDHTNDYRKSIAVDLLTSTIERVEKRIHRDKHRSFVLSGNFLPPHTMMDIRHETKYHLHYMTSWIEERTALDAKIEALPISHKRETEAFAKKQKADMASAHSALELDISKRRKEEIKRKEEEITKSREQELEKTKNSFTEENPMPANLSGDFFAETSKIIKEKKDEIKKTFVRITESETEAMVKKMTSAQAKELAQHEAKQREETTKLRHSSNTLSAAEPGHLSKPTLQHPNIFNPPQLYRTIVTEKTTTEMNIFRWTDFFNTTISSDEYNYLADNILVYFSDDTSALMNFALSSTTTLRVYKFHKARALHSTNIQTLRRCQIAKREMALRRLHDGNARILQRVARGMLGRKKYNMTKQDYKTNEALKSKMGADASIVKAFMVSTTTTEATIAAAEALNVVNLTNGKKGTALLFDTNAVILVVKKMMKNLKLESVISKTKSGKSEWATLSKLIGNLAINDDSRRLILDGGAGQSLLDMLRRGDSDVREEVTTALNKLSSDPTIKHYFVFKLHCLSLLNAMIKSSIETFNIITTIPHQLIVVNCLIKFLSNNSTIKDESGNCSSTRYKHAIGRNGFLPQLLKVLQNTTKSYTSAQDPNHPSRHKLLEKCCKVVWKLTETEENYRRTMTPITPETLVVMLSSSWHLANRLSLILAATTVKTREGKVLLKQFNIPMLIAQHMQNHNAEVRAAAMVAVEAFSTKPKVKDLKDLRWKLKMKPKKFTSRVEEEDKIPENMGKDVSDNILLLKAPSGLTITHEGDRISNTNRYLKPINIIPPPAREIRLESALNSDGRPWSNNVDVTTWKG